MSWREHYRVHPSAEVFPLMDQDELRKLADDISKNGLRVPIQTCAVNGATYVEDGRNRLDAMESLGWEIVNDRGEWHGALASVPGTVPKVVHRVGRTHGQAAADVIAFNILRRHYTKEEQVELINKALKAARNTDFANMARSVRRGDGGRLQGSTKDSHKAAVIKEAAKAGIGKRTVERALAKSKKPKRKKPELTAPDKLKPEYVWHRFCKFLDHWSASQSREVKKIIHRMTAP